MKKTYTLVAASAVAALIAAPTFAQSKLSGVQALNDKIDDITTAAQDDLDNANDNERFGPNGVVQGWRGSFALSASGTSGNTDSGELSGAGRLSYGVGDWNHSFGFAVEYGESNGTKSEEKFYATYEGNRYFSPEVYAFGLARVEYDGFLTDSNGDALSGDQMDAFLGAGAGYRFINTDKTAWRVQAGPGARYVSDINGVSDTEFGFIVSSRYYYAFSDTVSFTMDTDVLSSSTNTVVSNDAGLNFNMTDTLSTRVSYRTDFDSDPAAGLKSTDNTLGVSLVLSF
ncbi:MAG: DUF481 domain-containing protein [Celeribacter marinus]